MGAFIGIGPGIKAERQDRYDWTGESTGIVSTEIQSAAWSTGFEVRDGRIVSAEEYFGDNGPPPFDRSAWTERY